MSVQFTPDEQACHALVVHRLAEAMRPCLDEAVGKTADSMDGPLENPEQSIVSSSTPWAASMRFIQITLGLSLLVSGCTAMAPVTTEATAPTFVDYRGLSLRLKPGMSEQNVIDLLGEPTNSKLTNCGQAVGRPWPRKMLVYGSDASNSLVILFRSTDSTGKWVVSSWNA
jgi:hypothetical protein